ncbi:dTDP-4-dehydrorhamnose reductase [Polaribacter sp. Hel1_33_96]|mgnify:FL=1|uniref:dTDP-4-dehydrorhamnose reductase n=1 Tax=Polaribacter sp. Hel1_33_96 TaxID=1336805 RepID=UPI000C70B089|nr:dTDP-4-dehydrorhamnose reductase [Polaribacter sp. Hel1_33_96]PKV65403.1 dTDP-4-dehydrorhamnose reductase [Polaribacter sp. Hel1_33_96]
MNILITGSNGQLGNEIKDRASQFGNWNFIYKDLPELDITDYNKLEKLTSELSIDTIINCAAYTAVDLAESNQEIAYKVNVEGAKNLAKLAKKFRLKLVHVSTDFVFDGKHHLPYKETDMSNPLSVYGRTKLEGERLVLEEYPNSIILRTAWLYSSYGANFVKTMQRLGSEREELQVIFDQVGTPTWAGDLANTILKIISQLEYGNANKGLYHYSNEGVASWYDFAVEIMNLSNVNCKVLPIETEEYPTPAPRPSYSVLNKAKIKTDFNIEIPHWKISLKECINQLAK